MPKQRSVPAERQLFDKTECLDRARMLVAAQAEDEGLWFEAETAPEAYLQRELRRLHHILKGS